MSKKLNPVEYYTKVNELGFIERFHKFTYIACTAQSTDWVAEYLLHWLQREYLPFVRSSVNDIWIESVSIIEHHDSWYKMEVIFGDINDE